MLKMSHFYTPTANSDFDYTGHTIAAYSDKLLMVMWPRHWPGSSDNKYKQAVVIATSDGLELREGNDHSDYSMYLSGFTLDDVPCFSCAVNRVSDN